ncbi:MAG: peptidylprolyl isomerase [Burkholderiales bacterium]|jgi:peptidyl-prolyl cis-trans isomerase C
MNIFAAPRLALLIAISLGATAAQAQSIATVNGKPVPKARYEFRLNQLKAQGQSQSPDLEKMVKEEAVLLEMFAQEAESRGFSAAPEFKIQMEIARANILANALFNEFQKKNPISEAEMKAEYDRLKGESKGTGNQYRARHILVEKEDEAKELIKQIKGGAKFEELAKKSSKDSGSKDKGGDLDFADPGTYVPEFSAALTKLKKGEMTSSPVKSQYGFHIIKLEDIRETQFPPMDAVRPQLEARLGQQRMNRFRDEVRAKTKTDFEFSFDKKPSGK